MNAMSNQDMIGRLSSLVQLDIDAINAYAQAIEQVDMPAVRDRLIEYRNDHERHVEELSTAIRGLGGTPPDRSRDFKGFFIEGFTALRSLTGTEGALSAMRMNEMLTNKQYGSAVQMDFRADIRAIVERAYQDERQHLQYIQEAIDTKVWEQ